MRVRGGSNEPGVWCGLSTEPRLKKRSISERGGGGEGGGKWTETAAEGRQRGGRGTGVNPHELVSGKRPLPPTHPLTFFGLALALGFLAFGLALVFGLALDLALALVFGLALDLALGLALALALALGA